MGLFKYFSKEERERRKEEREKRKAILEQKAYQERINELKSKITSLQAWKSDAPIMRLLEIAQLERACGWPPSPDTFWPYVYSLGSNALLYLYAGENIHQSQVIYPAGGMASGATLTWQYAARKAYLCSQRGLTALSKLPEKNRADHGNIEAFFNSVIHRAEQAENVTLEAAMELPTFFHLDPGKPFGDRLGICFFALQNRDKPLDVMNRIRNFALSNDAFSWLRRPIEDYSIPKDIAEDLPVTKMRVCYVSDLPIAFPQRSLLDPDPANFLPPAKRRAVYGSELPKTKHNFCRGNGLCCVPMAVASQHSGVLTIPGGFFEYGCMYTEDELPISKGGDPAVWSFKGKGPITLYSNLVQGLAAAHGDILSAADLITSLRINDLPTDLQKGDAIVISLDIDSRGFLSIGVKSKLSHTEFPVRQII